MIAEKRSSEDTFFFTYHKQSGYIGFICAMLVVVVLESVAVSFLLYNWSPLLHWIHLVLANISFVYLIIDLRLVVKNPIILTNNTLFIKIGLRPQTTIPIDNIKEILSGHIHYEEGKKNKEVLDLSLLGFDEPTFEAILHEPIKHGKNKTISRIFFTIDDKHDFLQKISIKQKGHPF